MARFPFAIVMLGVLASPAEAQQRVYGGGTFAADAGSRGPIDLGTFPAAGGFVGWRFVEHWSSVGPDVTYPPDHPLLQGLDERNDTVSGGAAGGLMIPVKVASGLTIAPEVRVTLGLITDESTYKQFYSGRVMVGY